MLHTGDKDIIALLNEINQFLDIHYKKMAEYERKEVSVKEFFIVMLFLVGLVVLPYPFKVMVA